MNLNRNSKSPKLPEPVKFTNVNILYPEGNWDGFRNQKSYR